MRSHETVNRMYDRIVYLTSGITRVHWPDNIGIVTHTGE